MTAAAGLTDEQAVDIANRANIAWGNARTYYPSAIVIAIHEAYAAGAAAAMPPREPTTAWLVDLRARGVCRGWLSGGYVVDDRNFGWTLDPNAAVRFCRKVDADAYRERHGFTATADSCTHLSTEHIWLDAAPAVAQGETK